jgi:hypothetical protein
VAGSARHRASPAAGTSSCISHGSPPCRCSGACCWDDADATSSPGSRRSASTTT